MRDLLERLALKEPDVLWALVAIVLGYGIWAIVAGRPRHGAKRSEARTSRAPKV